MYIPPLLGRAVELHLHDLRTEVARDRQAHTAIVGTRTRGGIFLALRGLRPEREHPQPQPQPMPMPMRPRPAIA